MFLGRWGKGGWLGLAQEEEEEVRLIVTGNSIPFPDSSFEESLTEVNRASESFE